jgi:DNA-directed RNA polymerase specialized sigma24 family protein
MALVLRYYDGRSEAETSRALDCPVGTGSRICARAGPAREVVER